MTINRQLIKSLTPPLIWKLLKKLSPYGWFGNYSNWDDAQKKCGRYDSNIILEKCTRSALHVKRGFAAFERDSVLFSETEYNNFVLLGFLHCLSSCGRLNILDFGGALGSSYCQNIDFLKKINNLSLTWNIVEQNKFVETGKQYFQNEILSFYYTIEECLKNHDVNVLLLASVLQYLENPFEWINRFLVLNFDYIIFYKTAFTKAENDFVTIQQVEPSIYKASYPSWVFNEKKFVANFINKYDIILEEIDSNQSNHGNMYFKGFVFKLKK